MDLKDRIGKKYKRWKQWRRKERERFVPAKRSVIAKSSYTFLAIIAYGRSGSTALQRAMNLTPGVMIRGENQGAFRGLYETYKNVCLAVERHGKLQKKLDDPWFGMDFVQLESLIQSMRKIALEEIIKPSKCLKIIGFKEIRYTPAHFPAYDLLETAGHFLSYESLVDYVVFLTKLFPGIKFLINTRSPERTSKSGWWKDMDNPLEVLYTAKTWLEKLPADLKKITKRDVAIVVNHDDWSKDFRALEAAWDFLGLPWNESKMAEAMKKKLAHMQLA